MLRSHSAYPRSRAGFTVIELLVVIAVIAVLVGILVVAVQRSRETASRAQCSNNLRQLALAVQHYQSAYEQFPPGAVKHRHYDAAGKRLTYDRHTWCLLLLPYIEENNLYSQWVFGYNGPPGDIGVRRTRTFTLPDTGDYATGAVAAQPVRTLLCPSDPAIAATSPYGVVTDLALNVSSLGNQATWSPTAGYQPLPVGDPGFWQWGLTSYQGNGGTAAFGVLKLYTGSVKNPAGNSSDQNDSRDGTIYLWQYFDDPTGTEFVDLRYTVDAAQVRDGTSNTLLLGERSLYDPAFVANCYAVQQPTMVEADWGNPTGQNVFCGAEFPLNMSYAKLETMMASGCSQLGDPTTCACQARTANFSSNHSGGVNFALCDGSVRFISQGITLTTLQALSTRAGGEVIDASAY